MINHSAYNKESMTPLIIIKSNQISIYLPVMSGDFLSHTNRRLLLIFFFFFIIIEEKMKKKKRRKKFSMNKRKSTHREIQSSQIATKLADVLRY